MFAFSVIYLLFTFAIQRIEIVYVKNEQNL